MTRSKLAVIGKDRVSIRVLLSRQDYEVLCEIAQQERSDTGSLVRRAIARQYLVKGSNDVLCQPASTKDKRRRHARA